jgi:hypothetical protein
MEQSTNIPIATRTRSQKLTTQNSSSDETTSTSHQETDENFSKLSINKDEINSQQLGNSIEPTDNNMHSSLSMPLL